MQIVESSPLGLRTARLTFASASSDVQITLFPMVHVGQPDFFDSVFSDAFSHDVALVEGIRSPFSRRITRSYRWIDGSRALNLVIQPRYPSQSSCRAKIVEADLSGEEFAKLWLQVPLRTRLLVYFAGPIIGLGRRWFSTRATLARGLSLDDLMTRDETLRWNPETAALRQALLHVRDARLLEELSEQLGKPMPGLRRLAIIYGAYHMRAVIRELTQCRRYYVARSEWLTVFRI